MQIRDNKILPEEIIKFNLNYVLNYKLPQLFIKKINPKPDYPLKTLYLRAFQTGLNRLIYYDFTTVE